MLKEDLKESLSNELDDPENDELLDLLGNWIDEVIQDIATRRDLELLNITSELTLSSGESSINVPNMVNIKQIQRTDSARNILPKREQSALMSHGLDFTIEGPPNYWFVKDFTVNGIVVQFDRVAETDYPLLVNGSKNIIVPLEDSDHLPFPDLADYIIKEGVRAKFYLHEEQYQSAQVHEAKYERGIIAYLKTHGAMLATRVIMPQNSDLKFTTGRQSRFLNDVFQDRQIPDPDE